MKKTISLLALAGIIAGVTAQTALADSIDSIIVTSGDEQTIDIFGTLSGCDTTTPRLITAVTGELDGTCLIDLYAGALPADADACTTPFSQSFTLATDATCTQLAVSLYATTADDADPTLALADSESILLLADSGDAVCQQGCWETYDLCLADCATAADVDLCMSDCTDARDLCLGDCALVEPPVEPPVTEATMECTPETLNLGSQGNWLTCKLSLGDGILLEEVDTASILLNGALAADKATICDDGSLTLKFSRAAFAAIYTESSEPLTFPMIVELAVSGSMLDGSSFLAADSIELINPAMRQIKEQEKIQNQHKEQVKNSHKKVK